MIKKNLYLIAAVLIFVFAGLIFYGYRGAASRYFINREKTSGQAAKPAATEKKIGENVNGPSIKVSPAFYDLGIVIYGEVTKHKFIVENLGTEPLKILKLSTSCGCTKAFIDEDKKILAPKASAEMLVTFDPAVHKDDSDLGELTRVVYINSNDPVRPEVEIELKANVIKKSK